MRKIKESPYNPAEPLDATFMKQIRKEWRELRRTNPALSRALRSLTDNQLYALETEILEIELAQLRRMPRFNSNPELRHQAHGLEYQIRLNGYILASRTLRKPKIERRRYGTKPEPQPERPTAHVAAPELSRPSPTSNMHLLATVGADPSPSTVGPKPPIPNNVGPIPTPFNLDNLVGKCFGVDKRHDDIW